MNDVQGITLERLGCGTSQRHPNHPFETLEVRQCKRLFENFLAMSEAFPYLQAGSQKKLIMDCIEKNAEVPNHIAATSVVGNFLTWDETGGFFLMRKFGVERLPEIVDRDLSHVTLLRRDLRSLFGTEIHAHYGAPTGDYLCRLAADLENLDPIQRCAAMLSFEVHAGRMIEQLWGSLKRLFGHQAEELRYFYAHVGGSDPAESFHAEMANKMIGTIVDKKDEQIFTEAFYYKYSRHVAWCQAIMQ